jgi:antirestriction protein
MQSASDALRSVSDALMRDLEALLNAEQEKRNVAPDDPRLVTLAAEVDQLAGRVLDLTERQQDIAEDVHELAVEGGAGAPTASIEETHRAIGMILSEWRTAEREVAAAPPDSAEAEAARSTAERLREEYRRAYEARRG